MRRFVSVGRGLLSDLLGEAFFMGKNELSNSSFDEWRTKIIRWLK